MGNAQSSKQKTLPQIIDYVAANYIITSNFQDMKKLSDSKYCDNLVILTSKIMANNLSNLEVKYLAQRLRGNKTVNYMKSDKVYFGNKTKFLELDVRNKTQKRRMCIGIAKFYVKIAHVFAAIVTTVNPTFFWKQSENTNMSVDLMNKQNIPKDVNIAMTKANICSHRINALMKPGQNNKINQNKSGNVKINPGFCKMNVDEATGKTRMLVDEPGIPELAKLYFDKFNFDTGKFTGMTDKMRKDVYEKDVERFYKTFTGEKKVPSHIKTFSQIPLRSYHKMEMCANKGPFTQAYSGSTKDKLFRKYAEHIIKMMKKTEENQNKLIQVIDKLFVITINPQTLKKEVLVNPRLTFNQLEDIIIATREPIVDLYTECEKDFLTGLQIFEAIVNTQIMQTSKIQIENLKTDIDRNTNQQIKPNKTEPKAEPKQEPKEKPKQEPKEKPKQEPELEPNQTSMLQFIITQKERIAKLEAENQILKEKMNIKQQKNVKFQDENDDIYNKNKININN